MRHVRGHHRMTIETHAETAALDAAFNATFERPAGKWSRTSDLDHLLPFLTARWEAERVEKLAAAKAMEAEQRAERRRADAAYWRREAEERELALRAERRRLERIRALPAPPPSGVMRVPSSPPKKVLERVKNNVSVDASLPAEARIKAHLESMGRDDLVALAKPREAPVVVDSWLRATPFESSPSKDQSE